MSTSDHRSEETLARLACAELPGRSAPRVAIGGLGMGFTARAALDALPASAHVVIAEIVPAVVDWQRRYTGGPAGQPLDDPRVAVHVGDVADLFGQGGARYDAIILDVDNGPQGLTRPGNHALYTVPGLTTARRALRPGGILAVWSAAHHRDFERRLGQAGFAVEIHKARHTIYLSRSPRSGLSGLGALLDRS
ncbi:MAG: hypothetical protein AAGC55_17145 [Myxococcota bacterium]